MWTDRDKKKPASENMKHSILNKLKLREKKALIYYNFLKNINPNFINLFAVA